MPDECLSPRLAHWLADRGFDAACARDVGRLGERDDTIRDRCIAEDRIIVTHNAGDFRKLVGRVDLHPGLVILPETAAARSRLHMEAAVAYMAAAADDPQGWMVNRVLEVGADGSIQTELLPPP